MTPEMTVSPSWAASSVESSSGKDSARINQCAKEFEGLLLAQMLLSARAAGGGLTGDDDDSEGNSTLLELGEQQFAQALANSGALGIGKMVIAGLTKNADR